MPSPFPGIDPFIEGQDWEGFHHHLIEELHQRLVPCLRPKYIVRVERRLYVEHFVDAPPRTIRPDVLVLGSSDKQTDVAVRGTVEAETPVICTLPMPEEVSEAFLTVRLRESMEVVTVIEVLSPGNKRRGSDGRREYLAKREALLQSRANLVELDLLRGGQPLPTVEPLPPANFYVFVCRAKRRPRAEVYPWSLRQSLPTIPVPLDQEDPDVMLPLQAAFDAVYDRAGYDYSLDYQATIEPGVDESLQAWVADHLP